MKAVLIVETNDGGSLSASSDPLIGSYRANAASARYSRNVAEEIYGKHRTYGYSFGGSVGAYHTIAGMESTEGVWNGFVPYVVGSLMAISNVFSVRTHSMRILNDKFSQIIPALEPGGDGDMYSGLNEEEAAALTEVTKMGYFQVLGKVPGYLGANPTASLLKTRIQHESKVKSAIFQDLTFIPSNAQNERGTTEAVWKGQGQNDDGKIHGTFELSDELPAVKFIVGDLVILTGGASGRTILLTKINLSRE